MSWKKYQQHSIETSNAHELVLEVYDKCLLNLSIAKNDIEHYRFKNASKRMENTERLLQALMVSVNAQVYPEHSNDLFDLYEWLLVNIRTLSFDAESGGKIDHMSALLEDLADGYRTVLQKGQGGK